MAVPPPSGVVLLHGWPGSPADFDDVRPLLPAGVPVVVPDLFGPRHADATAAAHAGRVLELAAAHGLERPVVAGFDIGSRIAQAAARRAPEAVGALVVTPAYPGIGDRPFTQAGAEHWYQHLHRLPLGPALLDGNRPAVEAYLRHWYGHWSATPGLDAGPAFAALVDRYAAPGAMDASLAWYRQNQGYAAADPVTVPTTVLWGDRDPTMPTAWADALGDWFTDHELRLLPGTGHFVPREAPGAFASAIAQRLG